MKQNLRKAQTAINDVLGHIAITVAEIEQAAGDPTISENERNELFGIRTWLWQAGSDARQAEKRIEFLLETIRLREESEATQW